MAFINGDIESIIYPKLDLPVAITSQMIPGRQRFHYNEKKGYIKVRCLNKGKAVESLKSTQAGSN
jgi:uncharacterized protein YgiM (DUF1202 family)